METMRRFVLQPERRGVNGKVTVIVASAATEKRRRWGQHLQEAFAICEVAERRALERIMRNLKPRVLLLDLCLPGLRGVRELSRIQELSPRTKIIALAPRPTDREGIAALEEGAKGYYSRDIEPEQLRKAVEKVEAGEIWIQRRLVTALLDALRSMRQGPDRNSLTPGGRLQGLTPREYQVAELITEGACNKEIAQRLNIAERTVKAYLTELFRSLQVSDRLQLAVLLNREGLRSDAWHTRTPERRRAVRLLTRTPEALSVTASSLL
jgi:DNA-binding NarL/FixJ family response regulator